MRWLIFYILFLLFLGTFSHVKAQQYSFTKITVADGLSQSTIYDIIQDQRGYYWFATNGGGACRYNGNTIEVFNKENGLAGNLIKTICEDNKGNLWFGTDEGMSIYDGYKFHNYSSKNGFPVEIVLSLYSYGDKMLIGSSGDGLLMCSFTDTLQYNLFTIKDGLGSNNIYTITSDSKNRIWLGTIGAGINILEFAKDSLVDIKYINTNNDLPSDNILTFETVDSTSIWVGTYDQGIAEIKYNNKNAIKVQKLKHRLSSNRVWDIKKAGANIWVATDNGGINKISSNGKITYITSENGLPKNQTIKLFYDQEGYIWISALDEGLYKFLGEKFIHITSAEGLTNTDINSIEFIGENTVWAGTDGDGIVEFNLSNYNIANRLKQSDGLSSNAVNSIVKINGDLWIGSINGISIFDNNKIRYISKQNGLIQNNVSDVFYDSKHQVWIGTKNGISTIKDKKMYNVDLDGLENEINAFCEDENGNVWCATMAGLIRFGEKQMTTFDQEEGLNSLKIYSLSILDSILYIGTRDGGIYYLNTNLVKPKIKLFAKAPLIISNQIRSLIIKDSNTLIAGTNVGISIIYLDKKQSIVSATNYDASNGFAGIENNINSYCLADSLILFGTVDGISIYNPMMDTISSVSPQIHIIDLRLNFEVVNWPEFKDVENSKWSNLPKQLTLNHQENHLTFDFSASGLASTSDVSFKYKLEGLDSFWSPENTDNKATYSGIPPGKYTFKVIAGNKNKWSESPAEFSFEIKPPFYQTIPFYLAVIIFIVLSFILYIKIRERRLKKENLKLEKTVQARTKEVVEQKQVIEKKNKDIMSSIEYAKRIQRALLPNTDALNNTVDDYFILYKPQNVVSGDFYYIESIDNKLIISAADCTGHGVPGAFMSMLGLSYLNEIVNKNGIITSNEILNSLRQNIINALKQNMDSSDSKDGMDMSISVIDMETLTMQYSGAQNPIFLVRENEIDELKVDKMPVAIYIKMASFKIEEIKLQKGDRIYMASDGYVDQFGGPKDKKFMKKNFKNLLLETSNLPMKEQKEVLDKTIVDWIGKGEQIDDIVVFGVQI